MTKVALVKTRDRLAGMNRALDLLDTPSDAESEAYAAQIWEILTRG